MPAPVSYNQELLEEVLGQVFIHESLRNGLVREIRKLMAAFKEGYSEELAARLAKIKTRGFDPRGVDLRKTKELLAWSRETVTKEATRPIMSFLKDRTGRIALAEDKWLRRTMGDLFDKHAPSGNIILKVPDPKIIVQSTLETPFIGRTLREHIGSIDANLKNALSANITQGIQSTRTDREIRTGASNAINTSTRHVETVGTSSVPHAAAQAQREVLDSNEALIQSEIWSSTLDTRTTPICISLDGNEYAVGEGEYPPAHARCRSRRRPKVVLPESIASLLPPRERASMDGPVEDTTAWEWLKKQPPARQVESLGETKAKWLQEGKLQKSDLVDGSLKPRTIQEIEARLANR